MLHGKPDRHHFDACVEALGVPRARVCHVGDSLHHDVLGARRAGLDCVLVATGVHANELGLKPHARVGNAWAARDGEEKPSDAAVRRLCEQEDLWPTWVVPSFEW